ncbi:flagellar basal body-associated FliL family protein [Glycomyces arizonensis]|uniref:flagellar basal body-associated FliL family protein n=1 Tax=Glycomyces arizonensis TaxID=256035 RepID=UPI0004203F1F|nr:hypothetical protein [Glycomyces arizonensis]
MSNTPQPPADGWQPPQSPQEPPVYRPHEQPPTEEPPPWSPESQRVSPPPNQQMPVEDVDGTVKYASGPGSQPQAPFGPPPGVPVSPFDAPPQHPGMPPVSGMPGQGMPGQGMPPVSGMPAPGMPPVSGMPASGMPVSPGQGQFGPQGGQLVPVSGPAGQQPWGGAQPGQIQRKKKSGGKGPLWILLVGVVVIAAALGVGGFILFNPDDGEPADDKTATIEEPPAAEPALISDESAGLKFVVPDGAAWAESTEIPPVFSSAAGRAVEDGSASAFVGAINPEAIGATAETGLDDVGPAFEAAIAEHLGGEISGESETVNYWIDARQAEFHTFTVGDTTVYAALVQVDGGFEGFVGFATGDRGEAVDALRNTLRYGDL